MPKGILGFFMGSGRTEAENLSHQDAKLAAAKFDSDEIHVLKKTWKDLSDRSGGKGIDKETFLQYFPLNGLLGERLFAQFDVRGTGYVNLDEFITGLARVCRGTIDDKIHFLFNMYDVGRENSVTKQELRTLLNHVPKEAFAFHESHTPTVPLSRQPSSGSVASSVIGDSQSDRDSDRGSVQGDLLGDTESTNGVAMGKDPDYEEVDYYTNHDMVEKAFEECDLTHEGLLTYEEFKMWVQRTPSLMEYIESILPYNGPKDATPHHHKRETLPHMKRIQNRATVRKDGQGNNIAEIAGDVFNHSTSKKQTNHSRRLSGASLGSLQYSDGGQVPPSPMGSLGPMSPNVSGRQVASPSVAESNYDGEELARMYIVQAIESTQNEALKSALNTVLETHLGSGVILTGRANSAEIYRSMVTIEGYLWKKGKSVFQAFTKRFYLLSGNCVYYYAHQSDVRPKGVIFLTGSIIERIKDQEMALKGYYGFEITHQDLCTGTTTTSEVLREHHRHDKRILYCKTEAERDRWVTTIQHAAHVVPIEDDYVIGKELGRGRFSIVCECVHKVTGVHCAVKIIDKTTIEPEEKGLLRTEIAVLKLVNHPNIIHMEGLYESKGHIYIVMEMLKGGELFERIVGRPRFTELEAARLLRPLLESVAYLHDLGIVHRDLKPENILCGDELEDLKIADFGLSKMVLPKEKMDSACGTLSYVAPEVLTLQGYGKEADLWSVGVIMFLLLCGKLPFDGEDHNEIIRSTIQADLKVNPVVWGKLSEDAKSMITSLLNKNPKDRISARDALKHPFITTLVPSNAHHRRNMHSLSVVDNHVLHGDLSSKNTPVHTPLGGQSHGSAFNSGSQRPPIAPTTVRDSINCAAHHVPHPSTAGTAAASQHHHHHNTGDATMFAGVADVQDSDASSVSSAGTTSGSQGGSVKGLNVTISEVLIDSPPHHTPPPTCVTIPIPSAVTTPRESTTPRETTVTAATVAPEKSTNSPTNAAAAVVPIAATTAVTANGDGGAANTSVEGDSVPNEIPLSARETGTAVTTPSLSAETPTPNNTTTE